jgi:hypothetical protein
MVARSVFRFSFGFALTIGTVVAGPAHALAFDQPTTITIGVYDYAHAGSEVLLKAERTTSEILGHAGVHLEWLACPISDTALSDPGCANLPGPSRITMHIMASPGKLRARLNDDVFGFAAAGEQGEFGCDAWVFYDRVKGASAEVKLSLPQILGSVIAHELGHLLLGANSHTLQGLMRAHWSRDQLLAADLSQLRFSDQQCRQILNSVASRKQRT